MTRSRMQFLKRMLITLTVLTALMFPVMIYAVPRVHRWYQVRMITSPDMKVRERGLNYVIRHVSDARVLELTVARLPDAADENFLQIASALHHADAWKIESVGSNLFLRWLRLLAPAETAETRILVAKMLMGWPQGAMDLQVVALIERLLHDPQEDVRYNALGAIAVLAQRELSKPAGAKARSTWSPVDTALTRVLVAATRDTSAPIARHAWIYLGLIKPDVKIPLDDWRTQPPEVAEAMLWAATQFDVRNTGYVLEALQSPDASPKVRAAAVYALNRQTAENVRQVLIDGLRSDLHRITPVNQQVVWRTVLALPLHLIPANIDGAGAVDRSGVIDPPFSELLRDIKQRGPAQPATVPVLPLICAAAYAEPFTQWVHALERDQVALLHLAKLEGLAQFGSRWPVDLPEIPPLQPNDLPSNGDPPANSSNSTDSYLNPSDSDSADSPQTSPGPMIKVAHFAVAFRFDSKVLRELLASEEPTMRDLACIAAAQRLSKDELNPLIRSLLLDYNDDLKYSGAILAGITGLQRDFLQARAAQQSQWNVTMMMKLGLWMQRDPQQESLAEIAPGLLARTDLPKSSVLLAMLHRGHPAAFDYLLNPTGELQINLHELFEHFRWWRVFSTYLPKSAPPFWVWADADLQQFQIDVLRDWYLLNRHRLKQFTPNEPRP